MFASIGNCPRVDNQKFDDFDHFFDTPNPEPFVNEPLFHVLAEGCPRVGHLPKPRIKTVCRYLGAFTSFSRFHK